MKIYNYIILTLSTVLLLGCTEDDIDSEVRNQFIMKTVSPAIVGDSIEFIYAMATTVGSLENARVEASISGAPGSGFDNMAYSTDERGNEVPVQVANSSSEGDVSNAFFSLDTNAVTLRYYYVVPEAARGKSFSLKFSVANRDGSTNSLSTKSYAVSKMDLRKNVELSNNDVCYFSLATMRGYTEDEVVSQGIANQIDFRYIFDALNPDGIPYGHALVSLGTDEKYLNNRTIPASFPANLAKIEKRVFVNDMQISGELPATFVDDRDFETIDLEESSDFVLGISSRNSVFIESADGRYQGYLYFNSARGGSLTFGVKRYEIAD